MPKQSADKLIAKGKREILRGIEGGEIAFVKIAEDTDASFREAIVQRLLEEGVPYEIKGTSRELSRLVDLEVPCGALGYKKSLSLNCGKGNLSK